MNSLAELKGTASFRNILLISIEDLVAPITHDMEISENFNIAFWTVKNFPIACNNFQR